MPPIYIGVFLVSLSTLTLEISLTRILSVSQWYHFAFMVVSIALFGIGASGSFLTTFRFLLKRDIDKLLTFFSGLFSVSCIASFVLSNFIPFDPFRMAWDRFQILYILVYYVVLAVPFFLSGLCIAVVLSGMPKKVGRLYFSNLIGSGLGSLLVVVLFTPLSGSGVIAFTSFVGALSSFFFSLNLPKKATYLTLTWIIASAALLSSAQPLLPISISPYKSLCTAMRYPGAEILFTGWNAISRVDVVQSSYVRYAPGLSYQYQGALPRQLGITVDGDGLSAITHYEGDPTTLEFTDFLPMSLPFQLQRSPSVLIIGSGGGLDVLTAFYHDAKSIVAVEANPIIIDVVKSRYGEFSGRIYESDKVRVTVSEGRSFVRSCAEKYDVIQLSLTGNVAASASGVYALAENYLYTTEAFEDYFAHLSDDGVLSVTRWLLPPPREGVRLVSLAVSALENLGIADPESHIAVVRSWGTITLILKRNRFTPEDLERIREFCKERRFDVVYLSGITSSEVNIYNRFPEPYYYRMVNGLVYSEDKSRFYGDYLFDVSPVTDERPFFFHFFKWDKIVPIYESMGKKWQPFVEGGYLVPLVFVQALILCVVFILLPVRTFKRERITTGKWRMLSYFLFLGVGYMFIEIVLVQKFILFLGQPIYAVSTVLFTILTFSGIGSFHSERFESRDVRLFGLVISTLSGLIVLYLAFLPALFHTFLGEAPLVRGLISSLAIAPLGFVMGMPFPMGIRLTDHLSPDLIPWAWAVNGCSSVLGSILPVMIALSFGFSVVLALASAAYLAGLGMVFSLHRKGILPAEN